MKNSRRRKVIMKMSGSRLRFFVIVCIANVLLLTFCLLLFEGFSSLVLLLRDTSWARVSEHKHTQFDPELGWVNIPNCSVRNMYGLGRNLTTNSLGFRGLGEISEVGSRDDVRVVCCGDSFTLGYGVGDQDTWVYQLAELNSSLETVNMGQGGYGVDQAYLWYLRDGLALKPDVLLFCFISDDFERMKTERFLGFYGKPVLTISGEDLTISNYPIPRPPFFVSMLPFKISGLANLKSATLMRRVSKKLRGNSSDKILNEGLLTNEEVEHIAAKIFANLKKIQQQVHGKLVLVYLPTDYELGPETGLWHEFVKNESERQSIELLDLLQISKGLDPTVVERYFDPETRHFSVEGNQAVAKIILRELTERQYLD